MKRRYLLLLGLWCCLSAYQEARADNVVVFSETFDQTLGQGGNDGKYTGSMTNADLLFDNENWTFYNCYGSYKCLKFGSSGANGIFTTPFISLGGTTATLTFKAAGWGDTTKDKLTVEAQGCTVSGDINITELTDGGWADYTVDITNITGPVTFRFTGKRGWVDDIKVTGEAGGSMTVNVPVPSLTDEFVFWSNTIEIPVRTIKITPNGWTTVYYTMDGSEPTTESTSVSSTKEVFFRGTTTFKAFAVQNGYTSAVVTKTYTLGDPIKTLTDFSTLADGTETKLFLSVEQGAEVTAVNGQQFTLKDAAGKSMTFDFGTVAYDPIPAVEQLVAGWIFGQKQTVSGQATFVATSATTPAYMAFAAPIGEDTAIKAVATPQQSATDTYYTLSGQRIKQPKKGIYIANGKKHIIH